MKPKISVLIATYNRPGLISRAIESVLAQKFTDWEIVIVDDGSSDDTESICLNWQKKDSRIRYFKINHCGRIAKVSNFGLSKIGGEYVAILDDDDYWIEPEKLKKQINFLDKNREYVGCGSGFLVEKEGLEKIKVLKPENNEQIKKVALLANTMANSTAVFRYDIAQKSGFYDESLPQFADWDFWLKIGLVGKLYNFQEYFVVYKMWREGSSFMHQRQNAASALKIVKRYKNNYNGFLKAFLIALFYYFYTFFPQSFRDYLNPILSYLKKNFFSKT